jgi:hypothetical protein
LTRSKIRITSARCFGQLKGRVCMVYSFLSGGRPDSHRSWPRFQQERSIIFRWRE